MNPSLLSNDRRWFARAGATIFALILLYPFTALFARIGPWQWSEDVRGPALASVRVSLLLTGCAMVIIMAVGTPIAAYIARCRMTERLVLPASKLHPANQLAPEQCALVETLAIGCHALKWSSARMMSDLLRGRLHPGVAASNKFFTSNLLQALSECAIEILGPASQLYEQPAAVHNLAEATPGYKFLYNRCLTIAGGTSEVQRNIMAQRVLGLPR